jgi:SWI/SNF-related matrix-associated actin-dependent regulator of chromatin subfamily A member 5
MSSSSSASASQSSGERITDKDVEMSKMSTDDLVSQATSMFDQLIAQTDRFLAGKQNAPSSPRKASTGKARKASKTSTTQRGGKGKRRMNEKEEDEQMLAALGGDSDDDEGGDDDDDDDARKPPPKRLTVQPSIITGGTLRAYQLEGLNWLIHLYSTGVSGILADEMGLGKTLQTISIMAYLKEFTHKPGPHLICVPLSVLGNWCKEIARFCPSMRVIKFHGQKDDRKAQVADLTARVGKFDFDCVVTTYEMASR